jgi:hypothetical protein
MALDQGDPLARFGDASKLPQWLVGKTHVPRTSEFCLQAQSEGWVTQTVSSAMLPRAERLLMFSFVVVFLLQSLSVCGEYTHIWRMSSKKKLRMTKSKKNNNKPKLNVTVRDEQRNKLEQMASLENRSLSNLIEVMADERWKRLAEQQGVAYAKTVADAMDLKPDADNPADREKLRRAILDLVAGRKMRNRSPASRS